MARNASETEPRKTAEPQRRSSCSRVHALIQRSLLGVVDRDAGFRLLYGGIDGGTGLFNRLRISSINASLPGP
jgi:hypothetical protein